MYRGGVLRHTTRGPVTDGSPIAAAGVTDRHMDAPRNRRTESPPAAADWGWGPLSPLESSADEAGRSLAIAVVPFRGEGLAADTAFLADAITEDLIAGV